MSLESRILGPKSKYNHRIPYTYVARVSVTGVEGMTQSYLADTLCSLLERLGEEKVRPNEVTISEVRPEGEFPVLLEHCVGPEGTWLRRPDACRSFQKHYAGHVEGGRCCYQDRDRQVDGPIVEVAGE